MIIVEKNGILSTDLVLPITDVLITRNSTEIEEINDATIKLIAVSFVVAYGAVSEHETLKWQQLNTDHLGMMLIAMSKHAPMSAYQLHFQNSFISATRVYIDTVQSDLTRLSKITVRDTLTAIYNEFQSCSNWQIELIVRTYKTTVSCHKSRYAGEAYYTYQCKSIKKALLEQGTNAVNWMFEKESESSLTRPFRSSHK